MNTPNPSSMSKAERLELALDQAELAVRGFREDEALALLNEALRIDPVNERARLMQAKLQLRRNEPREVLRSLDAMQQYGASMRASRDRLDVQWMRAESLARDGQFGLAIAQLEGLLDAAPQDQRVLEALASLQLRDGRVSEAVETLTLLCTLDPDDAVAARTLSDLLAERSPADAARALGRVTPGKRRRAAQCCRAAGRLFDAEAHYGELLNEQPGEAQYWSEAAALAIDMGEMLRAEDRARESLRLTGQTGAAAREGWTRLAVQFARRGRLASAGRAWWRAVRCDDTPYPRGWAGLLTAALHLGRPGLMRRADRALRSQLTRAERRALLAACGFDAVPIRFAEPGARQRGEPNDASSVLSDLLREASDSLGDQAERFPDRADVRFHRAVALEALQAVAEAKAEADEALRINPSYAAVGALKQRLAA